jgi:hypothetical protein
MASNGKNFVVDVLQNADSREKNQIPLSVSGWSSDASKYRYIFFNSEV